MATEAAAPKLGMKFVARCSRLDGAVTARVPGPALVRAQGHMITAVKLKGASSGPGIRMKMALS
jgi:hypothetical protein